jgi:hypothetical protein
MYSSPAVVQMIAIPTPSTKSFIKSKQSQQEQHKKPMIDDDNDDSKRSDRPITTTATGKQSVF